MTARDLDASLSTLCLACGMCCDGNLFTQVPLAEDEAVRLRGRGLAVIQREDGSPALRQRCAALVGRCCAVYEERPGGCRRHVCMLHAALAADEVSVTEALEIVARAHTLLAAADAALGPGPAAVMQRARQALRAGEVDETVRAAIEAARRHLARHFQRDV
jgi:hypothetical protein